MGVCVCVSREICMEKLSLDSDSPYKGEIKRDTENSTPVRQTDGLW